ncbi:MAG TPA: AHH domain-containing protein [Longimicrobiaceae bacterium]|nr:AHH domain-containing protein [Longimicrobiaceae bacterium]
MTEMKELVELDKMMTSNAKNYCGYEDAEPKPWKCRIAELVGDEPTAKRLLKSMKKHDRFVPQKPAPGKKGSGWDISKCSKASFPFQTHHLIPKGHLPTHAVCTWLTKAYTKDEKFQIKVDNNYDTDHANNGYCMPFASTTLQWMKAGENETKQRQVAFQMMEKTGIQLHQGSHAYGGFGGEQGDVEVEGYLQAVDALLNRIHRASVLHVKKCEVCKQGDGKPNVEPVVSVVRHMDQASRVLKARIDANQIFVSEIASQWHRQQSTGVVSITP